MRAWAEPLRQSFLTSPRRERSLALARAPDRKSRAGHSDAVFCPTLAEAVEQAKAIAARGLLVCGSEAIALEAEKAAGEPLSDTSSLKNNPKDLYTEKVYRSFLSCQKKRR